MSLTLLIIAICLGLLLLTLEIVALPGGVAGICGGILVIVGIWEVYASHGTTAGNIILLCSIAVCIILLVLFMKSGTWRKVSLNTQVDSKTNVVNPNAIQAGSRGVTLSRLAPAGKALINGEMVEVHTISEFLDPDTPIEVIETDGYKIIVKGVSPSKTNETPEKSNPTMQ